jgi:outer membrane protein TolC
LPAATNHEREPTKPAPVGLDPAAERTKADSDADGEPGDIPPSIPAAEREYPVDLDTALRLAEAENPLIAEARQRIGEAKALLMQARAMMVPSLNAGTSYHSHTGNLQRSSGTILNLNQKSLYFGGGAEAVAAGTVEVPAVLINTHLTEAIFEPLAARQQVESARWSAIAAANTILLEVAQLHYELLAADAELSARRQSARDVAEIARLTKAYAEAQQGRDADAHRALTELTLVQLEIQHAEEVLAVSSSRLARRLHLEQTVRLRPLAPGVELVNLVVPNASLPGLLQIAIQRRPELGARAANLAAAQVRVREETYRPLLPTIYLGFSGGAFGGGSNLVGPELAHFGGRTDFDVMASWTVLNLGVGNHSLIKRRRADAGQAAGDQARVIAEVRNDVASAYADVAATRQQVEITRMELESAERGYREDLERIRNTVGRPLDAVNSLQLLNQSRVARIRAITDYNKAQFRLFVALGSPPPLGAAPGGAVAPAPAPIAPPLLPLPPLASSGFGSDAARQ